MKHSHRFKYPKPDGKTSTGTCDCGETRTDKNTIAYPEWNRFGNKKQNVEGLYSPVNVVY